MSKFLLRIVAILLLPCLISDLLPAVNFVNSEQFTSLNRPSKEVALFASQAISPAAAAEQIKQAPIGLPSRLQFLRTVGGTALGIAATAVKVRGQNQSSTPQDIPSGRNNESDIRKLNDGMRELIFSLGLSGLLYWRRKSVIRNEVIKQFLKELRMAGYPTRRINREALCRAWWDFGGSALRIFLEQSGLSLQTGWRSLIKKAKEQTPDPIVEIRKLNDAVWARPAQELWGIPLLGIILVPYFGLLGMLIAGILFGGVYHLWRDQRHHAASAQWYFNPAVRFAVRSLGATVLTAFALLPFALSEQGWIAFAGGHPLNSVEILSVVNWTLSGSIAYSLHAVWNALMPEPYWLSSRVPPQTKESLEYSERDEVLLKSLEGIKDQICSPTSNYDSIDQSLLGQLPRNLQEHLAKLDWKETKPEVRLAAVGLMILDILKTQPVHKDVYQAWKEAIEAYNNSAPIPMSEVAFLSLELSMQYEAESYIPAKQGGENEGYFTLLDQLEKLPAEMADRIIPFQLMQQAFHYDHGPFDRRVTEQLLTAAFKRLRDITDESVKARYQTAIVLAVHNLNYQWDSVLAVIDRYDAHDLVRTWAQTLHEWELSTGIDLSSYLVPSFGFTLIMASGRNAEELLLRTAEQVMEKISPNEQQRTELNDMFYRRPYWDRKVEEDRFFKWLSQDRVVSPLENRTAEAA